VILLDTHVVIWWVTGALERLSKEGRSALERQQDTPAGGGLLVSAISCWEVAMLVQRGRLALNMEVERWLALVAAMPAVRLLPLDPLVAVMATRLPEPFHADPADRFLVAQARHLGIPLLSADSKILAYPHVRGLW
jgi:PIN domain nuclease of toxin-antitoxin system